MRERFLTFLFLFALIAPLNNKAVAEFSSLQVQEITENNDGLREYAVYVGFDGNGTDVLLGVFNTNITSTTGFFHNTIFGGEQSALPYNSQQMAISDNPDADSFVTIGLMTGDNNATMLDPFFNSNSFIHGNSLGVNAGWFNSNPPNGQGNPDANGRVLIAVFTPTNDANGMAGIVSGTLTVGYSHNGSAFFGSGSFTTVPAPASVPLVLLPLVRSRRRRV